MKTVIKSAALFSAVSLLAACGAEEFSDNSVDQNYHNIKTTLQGTVFNAIDGKRITDKSLKVTLVQGTDYRKAKVRTGDKEFSGDYAIKNIPTSAQNNIDFRIVSKAEGYQDFETVFSFDVNTSGSYSRLQDKLANAVGNIYMYPLGSFASDVKVNVTYNNEPVVGATVFLNPHTSNNTATTDRSNVLFAQDDGFQQAMTAVTDDAGIVTFSAANLVLGGQYSIDVMPTAHQGIQLVQPAGQIINIGTNKNVVDSPMTEILQGTDNGLYVTSANNLDLDAVIAGGTLTLTFSRAVSFVNEKDILASLNNATTAALDGTDTPDSTVVGSLSEDGLTLTLTPQFAANAAPVNYNGTNGTTADNGLEVVFSNVFIRIQDASDSAAIYDVFALTDETAGTPSATVRATIDF